MKKLLIVCVLMLAMMLVACGPSGQDTETVVVAEEVVEADTSAAKVPITSSSAEALEFYRQGQALADDLRIVDAHEMFLQAVAADEGFAMGHFMVASTALTNEEFFEAIGKANELATNVSAGEQLFIKATVAASENDDAGQRAALEELVAMYPDDERTHVQLGNFLNGQQDFAGAAEHFGHAVEIAPDFAGAYNSLGYAYRSLEDFENSRKAFESYVELIPNEANPYDSLAELLMEMGEYDESIANYREALKINPNFAASYAGLTINHSLKGEPDLAQEAAGEMLAAARNFGERQGAMFRSITSHLFAGDKDAALQTAEMMMAEAVAAENFSAMAGITEYMGDIMLANGDAAKAGEYYDAALEYRLQANLNEANNAQAARAHLFKTAIAAMVGGNSEAAASLTAEYNAAAEANGIAFEKLRVHELSAYLAMHQKDNEAAAMHFANASQFQPIPLYWAARVNQDLGNLDKARDLAERAANRNTLNGNLPFFRADAVALQAELSGD